MIVYVWCRRNPYVRYNFFGLFTFQAPYLPWILILISVLFGGSVVVDLVGESPLLSTSFFSSYQPCPLAIRHRSWSRILLLGRCFSEQAGGNKNTEDPNIHVSMVLCNGMYEVWHWLRLKLYCFCPFHSIGRSFLMVPKRIQTTSPHLKTGLVDLNGDRVDQLEENSCHRSLHRLYHISLPLNSFVVHVILKQHR